jgi:hypothetical protein
VTVEDHLDEQLPSRLAELAYDASPVDATLLAGIRGRAAAQRRRRAGVAVVAAIMTLVVGFGGTVVVRSAISQSTLPATSTTAMLGWQAANGQAVPKQVLDDLTAVWDTESGAPHRQVRVLAACGVDDERPVYVVEGISAKGAARIAVLVGRLPASAEADPGYDVSMDVTVPSSKPQVVVVGVTGLGNSPVLDGILIGLIAPTAQAVTVVPAASPGYALTVDPKIGYTTAAVPASLVTKESIQSFTLDVDGVPKRWFRQVSPDEETQFLPKADLPSAFVMVPDETSLGPHNPSPSR